MCFFPIQIETFLMHGVALNARFLNAELYNHSIKYKITSVEGYVVGCINYLVILSTFVLSIQYSHQTLSCQSVKSISPKFNLVTKTYLNLPKFNANFDLYKLWWFFFRLEDSYLNDTKYDKFDVYKFKSPILWSILTP